jgi:hypothetical protein
MRIKHFIEYSFFNDKTFGIWEENEFDECELNEWEYYSNFIPILNDVIKDNHIEWNDFKMVCKEFYNSNDEIFADLPHTFQNQGILKQRVMEIFNIK